MKTITIFLLLVTVLFNSNCGRQNNSNAGYALAEDQLPVDRTQAEFRDRIARIAKTPPSPPLRELFGTTNQKFFGGYGVIYPSYQSYINQNPNGITAPPIAGTEVIHQPTARAWEVERAAALKEEAVAKFSQSDGYRYMVDHFPRGPEAQKILGELQDYRLTAAFKRNKKDDIEYFDVMPGYQKRDHDNYWHQEARAYAIEENYKRYLQTAE